MKQEEERVVEESAHAMEAMAASAQTEFDALVEKQKVARLHHLLEKSSKYTDFLYERMRNQQVLLSFSSCCWPTNPGESTTHFSLRFLFGFLSGASQGLTQEEGQRRTLGVG